MTTAGFQLPAPSRRPIWTDRWCVVLGLASVAADAGLALFLWRRLPSLPELLPVHFNAFGEVDLIGGKADILKLPLIGAVIWASNAALATSTVAYDRVLSRLLLAAALLAQVLIVVAAIRITQ